MFKENEEFAYLIDYKLYDINKFYCKLLTPSEIFCCHCLKLDNQAKSFVSFTAHKTL